MHGLVNRAVQRFVTDTYGAEKWLDVVRDADLDFVEFEAMLTYEIVYTPLILDSTARVLERPRNDVMEDIGTYLVSHPNVEALRRLLRFGGNTFVDFLLSLDDLPDRARLAVSDLKLPEIELHEHTGNRYSLVCNTQIEGFGYVMVGLLRTMADDYGALVFLEHGGAKNGVETVNISLLETAFAEGRTFDLGARTT